MSLNEQSWWIGKAGETRTSSGMQPVGRPALPDGCSQWGYQHFLRDAASGETSTFCLLQPALHVGSCFCLFDLDLDMAHFLDSADLADDAEWSENTSTEESLVQPTQVAFFLQATPPSCLSSPGPSCAGTIHLLSLAVGGGSKFSVASEFLLLITSSSCQLYIHVADVSFWPGHGEE